MPNLKYLYSKRADETYTINWFDGPQVIENNGYVFKSEKIKGIVNITNFFDETYNETINHYFKKYIKYIINDKESELIDINLINDSGITFSCDNVIYYTVNTNNIPIDINDEIIIEIIYLPVMDGVIPNNHKLEVNNIRIKGEYILTTTDSEAILENINDEIILAPLDIYKIFRLDNFILVSNHENVDIKYRFTQDNGRTFSKWLPLNEANIKSTKLNPLRFAKVEYLIKNLGQPLKVYDIILEGDFQNVSANYLKTNKYGLKEDCVTELLSNNNNSNNLNNSNPFESSASNSFLTECSSYSDSIATTIDAENQTKSGSYWNPYDSKKIIDFANMLGNQVSEIFGWDVDYHLTDPDGNGIDMYVHEYTLKNVIDKKKIKVIVPKNEFPVETLIINQFNLDLFDTFEIHIMKDEFKNKFGITRRPGEDDILYICQANMLYYVKHAQAYKDVMNAATYYKIILEKYEHKTNIRNSLAESKQQIDELTDNTTIDSLFGNSNKDDEKQIANKEQFKPLTMDFIRYKISSKVLYEKEILMIDSFTPVKSVYNFENKTIKDKVVIDYKKSDKLIKSDNRSFMFWFKFNNEYDYDNGRISNRILNSYSIPKNTIFSFLNNYDNNLGYEIFYKNDVMYFKLNEQRFKLKQQLLTNIWYIGIINLNQKEQNIELRIYKRSGDINIVFVNENTYERELVLETDTSKINNLLSNNYKPISNLQSDNNEKLILINKNIQEIEPVEFEINQNLRLFGSNIKYTNMRIFDDVLPELMIENMIKQNIVKESQHLIIADNANKKIRATNFYNRNWK